MYQYPDYSTVMKSIKLLDPKKIIDNPIIAIVGKRGLKEYICADLINTIANKFNSIHFFGYNGFLKLVNKNISINIHNNLDEDTMHELIAQKSTPQPKRLLILSEINFGVDYFTNNSIMANILTKKEKMTVIICLHSSFVLRTRILSDYCFVMDDDRYGLNKISKYYTPWILTSTFRSVHATLAKYSNCIVIDNTHNDEENKLYRYCKINNTSKKFGGRTP